MRRLPLLLLLAACVSDKEAGVLQEILDASFSVSGPEGLGVCSDAPVVVTGTIDPRYAGQELGSRVTVDGETEDRAVAIDNGGGWSIDVTDQVACTGDDDCTVEVTVYMETPDTVADEPLATSASTSFVITQDGELFYVDDDGDGFGAGAAERLCAGPDDALAGYARNDTDCEDGDDEVHPQATEQCNGIDDDCDDETDEGFDSVDYYPDADGDTFGDRDAQPTATCTGEAPDPSGWSTDNTDCNDAIDTTYPGAPEVCDDGEDNDCDGLADDLDPEGPESKLTYYLDEDGDGFYASEGVGSCEEPVVPYITYDPGSNGDCDDTVFEVNPGAAEVCLDGIDNNCNDLQDDDDPGVLDGTNTYATDMDGDGFVPSHYAVVQACEQPDDTALFDPKAPRDCNDANADANPGDFDGDGFDTCSLPIDCDDDPKTGAAFNWSDFDTDTSTTCDAAPDCDDNDPYLHGLDLDGDGYTLCDAVPDCNDNPGFASINPGAVETPADGIDQNCDTYEDCYEDRDNDSYGDDGPLKIAVRSDAVTAMGQGGAECDVPGLSSNNLDCYDAPNADGPNVRPGVDEVCNDGYDTDCDGLVDDDDDNIDASSIQDWVPDADSDGWAEDTPAIAACGAPDTFYVVYDPLAEVDCNDGDSTLNHDDDDGDLVSTCDTVPDCDDDDEYVFPGAFEPVADGFDQNCDGLEDCYADLDDDGFGDPDNIVSSATASDGPLGFDCVAAGDAIIAQDCEDDPGQGGFGINPYAAEIIADDVDQDCDGLDGCWVDADNDGEGDEAMIDEVLGADLDAGDHCYDPDNFWSDNTVDCNDGRSDIYTGALELVADGTDQNCDGGELCYIDFDEDTYGIGSTGLLTGSLDCEAADGFSDADDNDCDDTNNLVNPGAPEVAGNDIDDDCDTNEGCYEDADLDGFSASVTIDDAVAATTNCDAVAGWARTDEGDCDDVGPNAGIRYPGADELFCTGEVEDCDRSFDLVVNAGGEAPTGTPSEQIAEILLTQSDVEICDGTVAEVALSVTSDLRLHAATDATLSVVAGGADPIADVLNATLTLENLTLNNPSATQLTTDGGLIIVDGGELDFDGVTLTDGDTLGSGGAIYAVNAVLTLDDITCDDNVAGVDGGCLWHDGAFPAELGTFFTSGNSATRGGAVFAGRDVNWTTGACSLDSAEDGGCIYVDVTDVVTLDGVDLDGVATDSGGSIYSEGDLIYLSGTCNGSADFGGCIYVRDGGAYLGTGGLGPTIYGDAVSEGNAVYARAEVEIAGGLVVGNDDVGDLVTDIYVDANVTCWDSYTYIDANADVRSGSGDIASLTGDDFCSGALCSDDPGLVCDGVP